MTKKQHIILILLLAILFTLIIQLPLTKAILFDGYLRTPEIGGGATAYYLSLINESSKGNQQLGSPYLLEWRDKEYLYPALNINAAGWLKQIFGLDIKMFSLLMDYAGIFTIMALLLIAFLSAFQFHYFGYLAAAIYIFFPRHFEWARTLSPEINFIPFALFLVFYFSRFSFWKRELGLAFLAGILFYIYPYFWTFALVLLGVSDLWEFWQRKKIIKEYLYKYLLIGLIASWYFAHLWGISQLPYYHESMARIGALASRWPAGLYTQAALLLSLAVFFLLKKKLLPDSVFHKIVPGLAAGLIVLNQQFVTNMQLEFNSHYWPAILIFLVSFWSGLIFVGINSFLNETRKKLAIVIMVVAVFLSAWYWRLPIFGEGPWNFIGNRAPEIINWLIQNNVRNRVIYAPQELNDDINILTDNYLYFHGSQELQLMPTAELIDRFTYFDITNRDLTENLVIQQQLVFGQTFKSVWQKDMVLKRTKAFFAGEKFMPLSLNEYTDYDFGPIYRERTNLDLRKFIASLNKYKVDYLIYRQEEREAIYVQVPGEIVFEGDSYIIKKYAIF